MSRRRTSRGRRPAPSSPVIPENAVTVPGGVPVALKLDWMLVLEPMLLQLIPSVLYSNTWLVNPVPVRWVA